MGETFYVVRQFINGREGCRPSEFSSKDEAVEFINEMHRFSKTISDTLDCEFRLYEVKAIDY